MRPFALSAPFSFLDQLFFKYEQSAFG